MSSNVTFRFANESDTSELLELFSRAYPGRCISAAYYRWQFFDNPICPFSSIVAEQAGRILAHAGYTGRRAILGGREGLVFVKGTSMSDPAVRGSGVYSRLLGCAAELLATRSARLILSYPNADNHPVQILRPDYNDIYQIPALVRRPRKLNVTEYDVPGAVFPAEPDRFDAAVEAVGRSTLGTQRFGILRTAQYLRWRYAERPDTEYLISEDRQGGSVRSLVIWKYYPADRPDRIMVVEWLSDPDDTRAANSFEPVEAVADAQGLAVYTWQNVYERFRHKLLERRGYILGTPIFYFGAFRIAESEDLSSFHDFRNWHVAMGDVDVF